MIKEVTKVDAPEANPVLRGEAPASHLRPPSAYRAELEGGSADGSRLAGEKAQTARRGIDTVCTVHEADCRPPAFFGP